MNVWLKLTLLYFVWHLQHHSFFFFNGWKRFCNNWKQFFNNWKRFFNNLKSTTSELLSCWFVLSENVGSKLVGMFYGMCVFNVVGSQPQSKENCKLIWSIFTLKVDLLNFLFNGNLPNSINLKPLNLIPVKRMNAISCAYLYSCFCDDDPATWIFLKQDINTFMTQTISLVEILNFIWSKKCFEEFFKKVWRKKVEIIVFKKNEKLPWSAVSLRPTSITTSWPISVPASFATTGSLWSLALPARSRATSRTPHLWKVETSSRKRGQKLVVDYVFVMTLLLL